MVKVTIMNNTERLLKEAEPLLTELDPIDSERFEKNIKAFLKQCPDDGMLAESHVRWDGEEREFDILWDTSNLDIRFSIGIDEVRWHIWSGVNHHSKDDECFGQGVGGEDIDEKESFAFGFFDCINDYWEYHKEYWNPYRE
jgi:hypothetical protein